MNAYVGGSGLAEPDLLVEAACTDLPEEQFVLVGDDEGASIVRGMTIAAIISVPFWSLLGLAICLVL